MRTIKFKGQKTDTKEWIYGSLLIRNNSHGTNYWIDVHMNDRYYYEKYTVIPKTVSQFTGLLDKNGIEIYENDNVSWDDNGILESGKFFWSEIDCGFRIQMREGYMPSFKLLANHVEVL